MRISRSGGNGVIVIERIAVLGGSSVYMPEFIHSLITRAICVGEIVLIGRSGRKLELVANVCQRMLDRSGFPSKVIATTDLVQGVKGARYILNNVRVGGMRARLRDEKLPPKLGMIGDECVGAGGIANALRTLPVLFDYAALIEKANPEAFVINLTNPMGICVEALLKHSNLKVVGINDQPQEFVRKLTALLEPGEKRVDMGYIGLSHLGWVQDVKVNGRSQMNRLLNCIERSEDDGYDHGLIRLFRMIPTQRMCFFFHKDEIVKKQRTTVRYRAQMLHEAEQEILKLYQDPHLNGIPDLTRARNAFWYDEVIVPFIHAIEDETPQEYVLCVGNDGAIRDLPKDCSVEIPVRVSKNGFQTHKVGSIPRFLKGVFWALKESERLTIEAARHRSYEQALQALVINPFVPSLGAARAFLDRIIQEEQTELH